MVHTAPNMIHVWCLQWRLQDLLMEGGGGARFLTGSYPILYGLEGDKIFYSKVLQNFILDYIYPTKYMTH